MKTRLLIVFTILTLPLLVQSVHSLELDTSSYSLKQQIKEGWDIESLFCHNNQVLILKITDESPACVNPETKEKLLERGWAILTPKERLYDIEKTLSDKDCVEFGRWLDEFVDGNFNENNLIFDLPVSDELSQRIYDSIPDCVYNDSGGFFKLNTKHFIDFEKLKKSDSKPYPIDEKYQEHYEIEITGLKDVYIVGERYDFSYILSGYGHSCGGKTVTFPDSNGDIIGSASSASCIANLSMEMFVFDIQKERGTTYGHVGIKNPGTYTVTVIFDQPNKYFPTTASQEFRVVEK